MSFKKLKTTVACASVASLAAFGLVGTPAAFAAAGDVTIAPTAGSGTSVFTTDDMELSIEVANTVSATTLAYRVDNPDQAQLHIDIQSDNADVYGLKSDGSYIDTGAFGANNAFGNGLVVDFDALDIISVLIFEHDTGSLPAATGNSIHLQLDETATDTAVTNTAVAGLEYDDVTDPVTVTVHAWIETGPGNTLADALTIDTTYYASTNVTFVPPQDVSAIGQIERFVGATGDDGLEKVTDVAVAKLEAASPDVTGTGAAGAETDIDVGDTIDGVVLAAGDVVYVVDTDTNTVTGLYTVTADGVAQSADIDLTGQYVLITEGATDIGKVFTGSADHDASTQYATDGTVSTFNDDGDNYLGASLRFSNSDINLAQVDLSKWQFAVDASNDDDFGWTDASYLRPARPAGQSSDATIDALGRLLVTAPVSDISLDKEKTYKLEIRHSEITATEFISSGYQVVKSPVNTSDEIDAATTDSVRTATADFANGDFDVSVLNGLSAVTFTAQVRDADGEALEQANVPVLAVVTAGSAFAPGETLTVSGTTQRITKASGTVVTSGLSDADGEWSVTVTSSDSSSASAKYTVQFYVLEDGAGWQTDDPDGNNAIYEVDYQPAVLATTDAFTADDSVVSGSTATVAFSVVDQFGQPLSATTTGKTYSVELQGSDSDDLDLDAEVVNGAVSFSFENYVSAGGSDVLTAKLYTGSSTSPSYVSGKTVNVTLYNTNAVAGINVTEEFTDVVVDYTDYIVGKTSAAAPGPTGGTTYSGTVVDANGAGVPGAPVVISGDNMQFKNGTTFAIDSISLNADAAGAFSVTFWTHTASATGKNITVTSGGKTATSLVKSKVEDGNGTLSAANLRFSWTVPAQPVMNTTYAVVATVTDVWGNPIKGATVVFSGFAAAEFNAGATATKVTGADGTATAYLRSIKDVDGLAAINAQITKVDQDNGGAGNEDVDNLTTTFTTDVATTSWDETAWSDELDAEITFFKSAAAVPASSDQKVNAGSFKGYVAVYARGYEGQRLSAKIGNDWVIVPSIVNNQEDGTLFRVTDFTGAGVEIAVRIYIDRVLIDTINLVTK